ncbi:hypothetical protein N8T08_009675 [Aspergillus melleus]|uniref:Uncharacterized protein n=1 Tax=Aspergillus melleus TaxID=138277 RepID=A0ACC3ATV0_9EURO|nr:hypothetical protein N8T08_009675 [Aspergillus melleus]
MGKRSFWCGEDARKRRRERRLACGYISRAHQEEDSVRGKNNRLDKTKHLQRQCVTIYTEYLVEENYEPSGYVLKIGVPAPDIVCVKDFIRWYIDSAKDQGRLSANKKPTVRSTCAFAERFICGFEEATTSKIPDEDRKEIYSWIKKTLPADKVIEDIKKQKFNFTRDDFRNIVSTIWARDSPVFLHGLLKVFIVFALQLFLFTGARIGALIPDAEHKKERGLRYKHIDLVLFRSADAPYKVGWRIDQKWLKNHRDPNYTVFGIGIRDHNRPQFATGIFLLTIALYDGALFGIESMEDLAQYDLRDGQYTEIPLRWKDSALDRPVFRNVTAQGPQEAVLDKQRFCTFLRQILIMAGYSKRATIHDIRRSLGRKIELRHGSAPVSQIYGHKNEGTYPTYYQAHCSSIDTVGDVLDEEEETYHIDYFQGYGQFREVGLPHELPAEVEETILQRPELVAIRARIEQLDTKADPEAINFKKNEYRKVLISIRLSELHHYQAQWVRERRDWRILNRGKNPHESLESNAYTRALTQIMPEMGCIAETLSSAEPLSHEEKLLFGNQLLTQCRRDYDVVYLPGESPINGYCPVDTCQDNIQTLPKPKRSRHIHDCVRKATASRLGITDYQLRYCYECMSWFQENDWHHHSGQHLQSWDNLHCEVIIYRNTVIRPGYCPCCLWDQTLEPEERVKYWLHSAGLRGHIEKKHIQKMEWPSMNPICGCSRSFESEIDFRRHLHDVHGLTNAIWLRPEPKPAVKRKRGTGEQQKRAAVKDEGAASKSIKFRHYRPLPLDQPVAADAEPHSPNAVHPPSHDAAQVGIINREHADFDHNASVHARVSSDNENNVGDISTVASTLSSARTTPDLDLIDPRLLEPGVSGEGGITLANEVPDPPDDLPSSSNSDEDARHDAAMGTIWTPEPSSPQHLWTGQNHTQIYLGLIAGTSKMEYLKMMDQQLYAIGHRPPALIPHILPHRRRSRIEAERRLDVFRRLGKLGAFQKATLH